MSQAMHIILLFKRDPDHVVSLQAALLAGTDVHLRDAWGYTALHWAASRGHEAVTALLLSRKVRPHITGC